MAEVISINYAKDAPPNSGMESFEPDFVMHSEIKIFKTIVVMHDGGESPTPQDRFGFIATLDTTNEVTIAFNKLSEGGQILEPLAPQFWSSLCGSLVDRFGINWHICRRN